MRYTIIAIIFVILSLPDKVFSCWGGFDNCPPPRIIPSLETIFKKKSFIIDYSTSIDSLYFILRQEIEKLPRNIWFKDVSYIVDIELKLPDLDVSDTFHIVQEENSVSIKEPKGFKAADCSQIVIPLSLVRLLNPKEQFDIYYIASNVVKYKESPLIVRDTIVIDTSNYTYYDMYSACSIYANISQDPTGEYILTLNDTPYKMVKLSENHYVLRKEKE